MPKISDNAVVNVSVTVTVDGEGDVTIACSPNPVPVTSCQTLITFNLDTRGYRFRRTNAIELDTPAPDFPFPSWTHDAQQASLLDLCNNEDVFKYTVNVVNEISGVEYSFDPEIKNGGVNC